MGTGALGRTAPGLGGRGVMEGEDSGVRRRTWGRGGGQVVISSGVEAEMRPEMRRIVRPGPMIIRPYDAF